MGKSKWLNRALVFCPCYALFLNEKDYNRELDKLKVPKDRREAFITTEKAGAQCHYYLSPKKETVIFVALNSVYKERPLLSVFALLAHEAMHIWRDLRTDIGEEKPSSEFEAYAIQQISHELFYSFCKQTGRKAFYEKKVKELA